MLVMSLFAFSGCNLYHENNKRMNEEVVATFSFSVEADTEMTWEYLVSQIKSKGYEPKAGVYGDAVGAVAQSGRSYSVTAEL